MHFILFQHNCKKKKEKRTQPGTRTLVFPTITRAFHHSVPTVHLVGYNNQFIRNHCQTKPLCSLPIRDLLEINKTSVTPVKISAGSLAEAKECVCPCVFIFHQIQSHQRDVGSTYWNNCRKDGSGRALSTS